MSLGEPVLPAEHRAGVDHQTEGHTPDGEQCVHESGARHHHTGPATGSPVHTDATAAQRTPLSGHLRPLHEHLRAFPGDVYLQNQSRINQVCHVK